MKAASHDTISPLDRSCALCPARIGGHRNRRYCDACRTRRRNEVQRETTRRYFARDPDARRQAWIRHRYGITVAEYDAILERGCEACGAKDAKLCLDHDHATGRIRGALCDNCNKALGHLQDSASRVEALLVYIVKTGTAHEA